MFEHLNGMFALAIWDARRGRLVLARDRIGKKPLFYRLERDRLLFASELKSLLQIPGVPREVDPQAVDEYLTYQYVPHPITILRGFSKLSPAHYGVYENGTWTTRRYWNPNFNHEVKQTRDDYIAELRALLTSAVELRLQSDVPLGAFLSGGVDSSLVVGLMQRLSSQPVKTFTIGFTPAEYDESQYARRIAQRFGTEHHELRVEPNALEILPKLIWHYDEPFADSSAIPTYYVSKLAREHVTVALTGDGGDELFAGYTRYQAVQIASWLERLPSAGRSLLAMSLWSRVAQGHARGSFARRFARLSEVMRLPAARRYVAWMCMFDESSRANLYTREFLERLPNSDPADFVAAALGRAGGRDRVTAAGVADLLTYLPCDLMTKVDMASMANSLECRQPLLDYRIAELAMRMPVQYKRRFGRGKRILQAAFPDLLPAEVMNRKKTGFAVPLEPWFRGDLGVYAREVLLDPVAIGRGYFRRQEVERLLSEHASRQFNRSARLWTLLMLELWHREWADG